LLSLIASVGGEVCVCDLTGAFDVTGDNLRTICGCCGRPVVDCERRGTWVYYWKVPGALDRLAAVLGTAGERSEVPL
jgi:ArsR family transcriptional regulator